MKTVLLLVILFLINLNAQDDAIKKLFPGKWKLDIEKVVVYEEWRVINVNELEGISYSLENNEKNISEYLHIRKFGDRWTYIAVPSGQVPTLFTLTEQSGNKFVFENKEHDFPQKIFYEFNGDKLNASIEGEVNGEFKRKEFNYTLVNE